MCSNLNIFKEIYGNGCFYFNTKDPESILKKIYYLHSLKKKEILKKVNYNFTKSKSLNWNNFGNNYYETIVKTINLHEKKN